MVATMQFSAKTVNLGPVSRIPVGEGRTFLINQSAVAVFHTRGNEVYATQAFCSHKAAPLADGMVGARRVICPLHGCEFDLATGEPITAVECDALKTYTVLISEKGDILVRLGGPHPNGEVRHQGLAGIAAHGPLKTAAI